MSQNKPELIKTDNEVIEQHILQTIATLHIEHARKSSSADHLLIEMRIRNYLTSVDGVLGTNYALHQK